MLHRDEDLPPNIWKSPHSFQCGTRLYTPTEITEVSGDMRLGPRAGMIDEWSSTANHLFAKGMEPYSFAVLCGFAAPLLKMLGDGSIIVSLVGPSGLSLVHDAVASIWGKKDGLRSSGHLPVLNDTLSALDPDIVKTLLGKLEKDQSTFIILTGNIGLEEIAGKHPRVLEFKAEPARGKSVLELRMALKANAGHAGDAFLQRLIQPETLRYLQQVIPEWKYEIWQKTRLSVENEPWVNALTAVLAASVIVHNLSLIAFSPNRIINWAIEQVRANTAVKAMALDPCEVMVEFINTHIQGLLVLPGPWTRTRGKEGSPILARPSSKPIMRFEVSGGHLYIAHSPLHKFLRLKGVKRIDLVIALKEIGVMISDNRKITLGAGTSYSDWQVPTYLFNGRHPLLKGTNFSNF